MKNANNNKEVVVGITGASGVAMATVLIDQLLSMQISVIATVSSAGRMVWQEEMDESFGTALERWTETGNFAHYPPSDLRAPIASGTYPTLGMVIIPCSMNTIGALAGGMADNLIRRAADVCIKEQRPLVLVPRETPLHAIHLENMASLSRLGVTILPPDPPFYLRPQTIDEIIEFVVQRTLLALKLIEKLPGNMRYEGPSSKSV